MFVVGLHVSNFDSCCENKVVYPKASCATNEIAVWSNEQAGAASSYWLGVDPYANLKRNLACILLSYSYYIFMLHIAGRAQYQGNRYIFRALTQCTVHVLVNQDLAPHRFDDCLNQTTVISSHILNAFAVHRIMSLRLRPEQSSISLFVD